MSCLHNGKRKLPLCCFFYLKSKYNFLYKRIQNDNFFVDYIKFNFNQNYLILLDVVFVNREVAWMI